MYERMKNELQTYENNIGFLSISSKGGGGLLKEMERKIDKLKNEMALIIKKIDAIKTVLRTQITQNTQTSADIIDNQ